MLTALPVTMRFDERFVADETDLFGRKTRPLPTFREALQHEHISYQLPVKGLTSVQRGGEALRGVAEARSYQVYDIDPLSARNDDPTGTIVTNYFVESPGILSR